MDSNSQQFTVVCSQCGKETTVPFEPVEGRPVYCMDCYKSKKNDRRDSGSSRGGAQMHSAICSNCGKETTVPFIPNPNKPVYCRECYQKMRN